MRARTDSPSRRDTAGSAGAKDRFGLSSAVALGVLVATLVLATVRAAEPLGNYDMWFHLALGREFLSGWSLQDPGRLTEFATVDWVPTQWSAQILAAKVNETWGLPGVAWLFGLVYLGFTLAVYAVNRRVAGPLSAAVTTAGVLVSCYLLLSARPQSLSLVFIALTLFAWLGSLEDGQPRWWLVPMTWVWATAHGLWSVGLLVGTVCLLGALVERRLDQGMRTRLAVLLLSCAAACLVTPLGPDLLTSQFAVASRSSLSGEWNATDFRSGPALSVALMACVVVILWARGGRQRWSRVILVVVGFGLAAYSERFIGVGAILVAPVLAEALTMARPGRRAPLERVEVRLGIGATLACLAALAVIVPRTAEDPVGVPTQFLGELDALPAGTPVLGYDLLGGWIELEAPHLNPVADGMLDWFTVDWIEGYRDAFSVEAGWQSFVAETGSEVAVLPNGVPLTTALQDQLGWEVVARDGEWVYLEAPPTSGD